MALLFTCLLTISGAIVVYFIICFNNQNYLRDTEAAIDMELKMISYLRDSKDNILSYIELRTTEDPLVIFRYEDRFGNFLGGTNYKLPNKLRNITKGKLHLNFLTPQGTQTFIAKIHTFEDGYHIIVARNVHGLISNYTNLKFLSWVIISLITIVALMSFGISYFVVSRINRIGLISNKIVETGDLSQRLDIDSRWDDLSSLAEVLNGFLTKIEELMNSVREVTRNIAHDLRTPLSSLRNDIEVLKEKSIHSKKIEGLLADTDRILAIFNALLRITNIEKGNIDRVSQEIDLKEVIHDAADLYEPLAEEKDIQFDIKIADSLKIIGDRNQLFQLFANIIDNAIKFSPRSSIIKLYADKEKNRVFAFVEDQGPGIPESEKENVFRHFYRIDASRSTPGNGLGLSLAKAVAEKHQAQISLENANPGLRVRISF